MTVRIATGFLKSHLWVTTLYRRDVYLAFSVSTNEYRCGK